MTVPLLRPTPFQLDAFHAVLVDVPDDERWELIHGQIVKSMVGARWEHARIVSNLHFGLRQRLQDKRSPCRLFAESFRLEIGDDTSLFPEIMIACTPLLPRATAHRAPTVLMEVLSDDPGRDPGAKWQAYQAIETLRHYVIVERDRPRIEIYDRQADGWRSHTLDGLGETLALPALDLTMPLTEIYVDVFA